MLTLLYNNKYIPIFIAFLLSFLSNSAIADNVLPDLGSPDLVIYDSSTEQRLGEAFKSSLHRHFKISKDPIINQYIRDLGHQLASFTGKSRNFRFYVIEDSSINAFAGPNGIIGIHTGLIKATESEAELAAVIAHEISHVTQNHLSRRYEYASSYGNLNSIATLIAAILIGSVDPNAGMATLMGGMGYNLQQQLKNSRTHESEADSIGIKLLYQAGYDPHAMGDFFGRLSKNESLNTFKLPEILRTHPVSESRLAEAENRAEQLEPIDLKKDSAEFKLVRIKINPLENLQFSQTTKLTNPQECYKQTLSTNEPANCLIDNALKEAETLIYLTAVLNLINKNQTTISKANKKAIIKSANLNIDLYPKNSALLLAYANLIARENSKLEAIALLENRIERLDYQYQVTQKLSELYAENKKMGYAYYYLARYNLEIGNAKRAKYYLSQATDHKNETDKTLESKILLFSKNNDNLLKNIDKQE